MRTRLALPATLTAVCFLALAGAADSASGADGPPPAAAAQRDGASDTGAHAGVRDGGRASERWYCTPIGCAGPRASAAGAALGFGATALAAAWLARRRPAGSE